MSGSKSTNHRIINWSYSNQVKTQVLVEQVELVAPIKVSKPWLNLMFAKL